MEKKHFLVRAARLLLGLTFLASLAPSSLGIAQDTGPVLLDPALGVRTVVDGLELPTSLAFIGEDEMLVLEKNSGRVQHVMGGAVQGTALDLAVNNASERGLLGIALDPAFEENGHVYLYWSCMAPPPTENPFYPTEFECNGEPQTGEDSDDLLGAPLLGNRVDRFVWDGSSLTWDMNLVVLRSFQNDAAPLPRDQGDEEQPPRANHDGGVITFGTDGKLYIIIGDVGRRGALQNLPFGPIDYVQEEPEGSLPAMEAPSAEELAESADPLRVIFSNTGRFYNLNTEPDDQFGGPYPDDAHYTGVILRLNPDGTSPEDNPFFGAGERVGGEIGENLQMTFAYGIRNSFGMDVDPMTGIVWISENGEDAYDELNLVRPGFNSGWIQTMGPIDDVADYKEIEETSLHFEDFPNLQQFRWGPEQIADKPGEARRRMFVLPGSQFSDPEFSWEFAIAPAAVGFVKSEALGAGYNGDLLVGMSVPLPLGGPLLTFNLNQNRNQLAGVGDMEAENEDFNSLKESEEFVIGTNFGIVTDIETGPNGNLYLVSLDHGAVYEIFKQTETDSVHLKADLTGKAEVPGPGDPDGMGKGSVFLNQEAGTVCFMLSASDITLPGTGAHIHIGRAGVAGDIVVNLVPPDESGMSAGCTEGLDPALIEAIIARPASYYVNIHTSDFPAGAIRGQLKR